jgi:hypothetical protein
MSFLADVLAHTSFFMAFLVGFYFLYVTKIQVNSLINDLFDIIKDQITTVDLISPNLNSVISDAIDAMSFDSDSEETDIDNNNKIIKKTAITVGILAPLLLGIAIWLQYSNGGSIFDLLLGNLIVICFIACAEFAIVGIFMSSFVEIDKDFVKAIFRYWLNEDAPGRGDSSDYICNFQTTFEKNILPDFIYKIFNPGSSDTPGTPSS